MAALVKRVREIERLEIAMENGAAVGVADSKAQLQEEAKPPHDGAAFATFEERPYATRFPKRCIPSS